MRRPHPRGGGLIVRPACARTLIAACALLVVAACVRGEPQDAGTPAPLTSAPEAPSSPAGSSAPASATQSPLPDGRSFGYIRSVDAGARTISFDLAQWLEGDEADRAAAEDGVIESGEQIENDYYIRNESTRLRTLRLTSDATIRVVGCAPDLTNGTWDAFAGAFDSDEVQPSNEDCSASYRGTYGLYWVTVTGGRVTLIEEQYVP